MNGRDLYGAMGGIDDRFLAMADAPNKGKIFMKKKIKLRKFLIAAALISLLLALIFFAFVFFLC